MRKNRNKKSLHYTIIAIFTLCFLFIATSIFYIYNNYFRVEWSQASLTETTDDLSNPYCGWYRIYGYMLSDNPNYTEESILESCKEDTDTRLALIEINLKNYRKGAISDYAIQQLDTVLSSWEKTNKKLILRFLYDWDGKALYTEPGDISIILNHMSQVASVINNHNSAIYTLQGIFVGNYGEMNNSHYLSKKSMQLLINQLKKVTHPSIYLSVRTPAIWRQISSSFKPLAKKNAYSDSLQARTGLFNDGMLGSKTDTGTYGKVSLSKSTKYTDKGTRADELEFQNQLCRYVPNGGEVIIANPYNDLSSAIKDLSKMHVSYLNNAYDPTVLNKWKTTTYQGPGLYKGFSGYDYIGRHLGYRFVLRSTQLSYHTFSNTTASFNLKLENIGFANCYKQFKVSVFLKNIDTEELTELPVNTDSRNWLSQKVYQINLPIDIRSFAVGNYDLYFTIIDPVSKQEILIANNNHSSFGYYLGRLAINNFPSSNASPTPTLANCMLLLSFLRLI